MKKSSLAVSALCGICLILDSRCAAESAACGLALCLRTVIPGIFPLLVLAELLLPNVRDFRFPKGFSRFLGIPGGSEGIFLLGVLGGFPVGARSIQQAVENRQLSKKDGETMLGLCCQCAPAFLFGVLPAIFSQPEFPLLCFLIQLESAAVLAHLRPGCLGTMTPGTEKTPSLSDAISGAIRTVGTVCAWIILASVGSGFLEKYLFCLFPHRVSFFCTAVLELARGCLSLRNIPDAGMRLLLCMGLVSFGGVCVHLQIRAIAADAGLSTAACLRQKLLQAALSVAMAGGILRFGSVFLLFPIPAAWFCKKVWKNLRSCVIISPKREGYDHAVS